MSTTILVALLGAGFLAVHFVGSHPPVRSRLIGALGDKGFQGLYSLLSVLTLVPMIWLWWGDRGGGTQLWPGATSPLLTSLAEALMVLGFALLFGGSADTAPSSFMAKSEGKLEPYGLTGITRHPVNIGMALWTGAHVVVSGAATDVAFFGSLFLLGTLGPWHQDRRLVAARPEYARFVEQTTFFPWIRRGSLEAISGKAALGALVGGALAIGLRIFHGRLFG